MFIPTVKCCLQTTIRHLKNTATSLGITAVHGGARPKILKTLTVWCSLPPIASFRQEGVQPIPAGFIPPAHPVLRDLSTFPTGKTENPKIFQNLLNMPKSVLHQKRLKPVKSSEDLLIIR